MNNVPDRVLKVRTPLFPTYAEVRTLLPILEGVAKPALLDMLNAIYEQTGTPQSQVDWTEPDTWIGERLKGPDSELARRIWEGSRRTVNPRHLRGSYWLINRYGLLETDSQEVFRSTERGRAFTKQEPDIIREIDDAEGLLQLLDILAAKTRARRSDLLPEWSEFLLQYSNYGTETTIVETLRRRLINLIERGLVEREAQSLYVITSQGLDYVTSTVEQDPKREVLRAITAYNESQRKRLRELLGKMHPYRFEHLIRELLLAMGYEDVQVTKASGDKGVDVIATIRFGITTLTEVVQVKRQQANVQRRILDELRGALHYHKALRGTIVTLSDFSPDVKKYAVLVGAAPIGLINGEQLLDLLTEHKIGLKVRPANLHEIDAGAFSASPPADQLAEEEDPS